MNKQLKIKSNDDIKISEFKQLKSSYISILKRMEEKGIFEIFEKEVKRNIILGNSKLDKINSFLNLSVIDVFSSVKKIFSFLFNEISMQVKFDGSNIITISLI